jgi:hypothetical protein
MTEDPNDQVETDVQESNPGGGGPERLGGGMGVSSERTGPLGEDPADTGVQGTGSHGTATESTDGVSDTSRADPPDAPVAPTDGPETDGSEAGDDTPTGPGTGIDRTVGEANTAEVPGQVNDPARNPGHSHG